VYDVLKSRNGHLLQQGGKRAFDAGFQLLNETFPFYALQAVLQLGEPLLWESDTTVKRTLKDGSEEWLVFGNDGHLSLIRRVQKGLVTEKRFSDYRRQDGLYYPKRVSNWSNGELVRQDDVASLAVNQAFDQKFLVIPDGYKTAPPAPPMKATAIAKDVYLIEQVSGGRNVLFVDLADGVLVTEAPVSKEVSQGIIQLIQQTLPGKKIRYVHLSHFHNDHTTGINAFLAAGATLIATPATIAAVKTLVPPDLAASASFLSFTKEHQLQDAAHRIHFYEVPNTHAEGMSMVYLPQEQIIYQGDLYSLPDDRTITPAIATNRDFYQFLKRNKLAVKRIIGHHGASDIGMEDLEKAVKAK
jgi:glyoxylase-like metal-dependent hydrolase (beta-lactamase superfamily II)